MILARELFILGVELPLNFLKLYKIRIHQKVYQPRVIKFLSF
jgi:hypothetical protein